MQRKCFFEFCIFNVNKTREQNSLKQVLEKKWSTFDRYRTVAAN